MTLQKFVPRGYQKEILRRTIENAEMGVNTLIELDCGAGKRYLQYELLSNVFGKERVILLLQASTSLHETYRYFKDIYQLKDVEIIDSRQASQVRAYKLKAARVVLALPQTLMNTIKKYPDAITGYSVVLINEVDQIIRRRSTGSSLKQPYPKLLPILRKALIIGMSGTLRDNHYVVDNEQMIIKQELETLKDFLTNTSLISMDQLNHTDIKEYISTTTIIPEPVLDDGVVNVSIELQSHIEDAKQKVLEEVKAENPNLYSLLKKQPGKIFQVYLPVTEEVKQKFERGYLVRKYLWALPGNEGRKHLFMYGVDGTYIKQTLPDIPKKFHRSVELMERSKKSVILCSYLATCDLLEEMLKKRGIPSIKITGKVPHKKRDELLMTFRQSQKKMVAIISNVGERDLDIPEADTLIVFDLVRTIKTVYQKIKRTRGGRCHILYYDETEERKKANSVIRDLVARYPWSTKIGE